jgi:hypothetical protein
MKSGTTTLCRWLAAHPHIGLPSLKEPNFFSYDHVWRRGIGWYRGVFAEISPQLRTGEASVTYTDPRLAGKAAERLHETAPEIRLICVLRHPIGRLRSHYRHEVQRGRERRSFVEAIQVGQFGYIDRSRYAECLSPWIDRFARGQLCVVRFEDLMNDDGSTWQRLLEHIGVPPAGRPEGAFNVTASKEQFTGPMRVLWESGLLPLAKAIPAPIRRLARRALMRRGGRYAEQLADSDQRPPDALLERVWEDVSRLPQLIGDPNLTWSRTGEA